MITRRALLAAPLATPALAQGAWPDRPIRVIIPFGPGGPTDIVGRLIADHVGAALGQPIVIDNRAGAGGNLGTRAVAQAAPDGNTLLLNASGPMVINPWLYRDMGFAPLTDLAPISMLTTGPLLLISDPRRGWQSVADLIAAARARPGAINFATAGNGTVPHLATELFARAAGLEMTNVVYRATPQATQSVISGETAFFFDSPASITHARAGAVRALAVTTPRRFPPFPDIPTVAEAGGPDISAEAWYGLFAPAGTPPDRLARLHAAFTGAITRPEVVQRLNAMGFDAVANAPAELAAFLVSESAKWRDVIQRGNIRLE